MLRYLTVAVILAGATPALAQPCKITRKDGGLDSFASATIDGSAAKSIVYGQGPRLFDLKIDPAAKASGYTFRDNGKVGLHVYRSGKSLDGKDWMQAGSIGTELAAFEIDWPRLFLKKDMVKSIGVELKMGDMAERDLFSKLKEGQQRDGAVRLIDFAFNSPRNLDLFTQTTDLDEEFEIEAAWAVALGSGKPMTVDFYDATNGGFFTNQGAKVKIATATIAFPADDVFQPRYVADITALRKAFTEKRCEAAR